MFFARSLWYISINKKRITTQHNVFSLNILLHRDRIQNLYQKGVVKVAGNNEISSKMLADNTNRSS